MHPQTIKPQEHDMTIARNKSPCFGSARANDFITSNTLAQRNSSLEALMPLSSLGSGANDPPIFGTHALSGSVESNQQTVAQAEA